jgi:prepilin-type processing-associated H-X9-DG protein
MLSTNAKDAAGELGLLVMLAALVGWVVLVWGMERIGRRLPLRDWVGILVLIVVCGIAAAILGPIFAAARSKTRGPSCLSNLKQIEVGLMMYAEDWDDNLPAASHWSEQCYPYVKNEQIWHCPEAKSPYSYAYNQALNALKLSDMAEQTLTVNLFESDATTWNASGGIANVAGNRHDGGSNYGFLDGHARFGIPIGARWQPLPQPPHANSHNAKSR